MKLNRIKSLALGVALLCCTTGALRASQVRGSFSLPFQTYWGTAVLPAGDYTFQVGHAESEGIITISQGKRVVAVIRAQTLSHMSSSESAHLLVVGQTVRSLHLASVDMTYGYAMSKRAKAFLSQHPGWENSSAMRITAR